jgi:hypothetical protein
MEANLAHEVEALAKRLRQVEDTLAIMALVANFGPSVDGDARQSAIALWKRDGVYDLDAGEWRGHAEIEAMLASSAHQDLLAAGCAHQVSVPRLEVNGDSATAIYTSAWDGNDAGCPRSEQGVQREWVGRHDLVVRQPWAPSGMASRSPCGSD